MSPTLQSPVKKEPYVIVKALDGYVHRIAASHILYIATQKYSAKLQIYTTTGTITVNETLTKFEQKNPGLFVRIHSGYLLNPAYVRNIRRFVVTLSDGTELPIPEKKYTQIKKLLLNEDTEKN